MRPILQKRDVGPRRNSGRTRRNSGYGVDQRDQSLTHKLIQSRTRYSKIGDRECRNMLERHIAAEEAMVEDDEGILKAVDAEILRDIAVVEAVGAVAKIERSDVDVGQWLAGLDHQTKVKQHSKKGAIASYEYESKCVRQIRHVFRDSLMLSTQCAPELQLRLYLCKRGHQIRES